MNEEELEIIENANEEIKDLIYTIRGKQVMLDSDVAMLYNYKTKRINETVRRNIERFPERFCFRLNKREFENLRSQFATSSLEVENYGGRRTLPYVFTEEGIAMLSGLLKNEIAVQVSIRIIDAFVEMRKFLNRNNNIYLTLNNVQNKLVEHDKKFDYIFDELEKNKEKQFDQQIFFNGQIYDAYSLIIDLIKTAKEKILIIDNYIDDSVLKMLSKKNKDVEVVILTTNKCNINKVDIQKFNKEYPLLKLAYTKEFHDRFMIIDNEELYHIGASLKDLGKKCFAISKIQDIKYVQILEKKLKT